MNSGMPKLQNELSCLRTFSLVAKMHRESDRRGRRGGGETDRDNRDIDMGNQ